MMNFQPDMALDDIINAEIEQEHLEAANRKISQAEKNEVISEAIKVLNP